MGLSRDFFGDMLEVSGPFWGPRGASWGTLGALLGGLGALVGLFGEVWEVSWGHLGGHRSKKGVFFFIAPSSGPEKSPLGALLGRSLALVGPSWASLGPVLGLSWAILGPS